MTNSLARLCALVIVSSFAVACAPDSVGGEPSTTTTKSTPSSSDSASTEGSTTDNAASGATDNAASGVANSAPPRAGNTATNTTPATNTNPNTTPTITTPATNPTPAAVVCTTISDSVTESYKIALLRQPDTAGFQYWVGQLQAETQSRLDVLTNMVRSDEFANLHAGFNDTQYVTSLYTGLLGREPDADGVTYWLGQLANGASRADVAADFVGSTEFATPAMNPEFACYF